MDVALNNNTPLTAARERSTSTNGSFHLSEMALSKDRYHSLRCMAPRIVVDESGSLPIVGKIYRGGQIQATDALDYQRGLWVG